MSASLGGKSLALGHGAKMKARKQVDSQHSTRNTLLSMWLTSLLLDCSQELIHFDSYTFLLFWLYSTTSIVLRPATFKVELK